MNKNFDDFLAEYIDRIRDLCKTEDEVFTDYYRPLLSTVGCTQVKASPMRNEINKMTTNLILS